MSTESLIRVVIGAAGASLVLLAGTALAHADPPSAGDQCSQYGASTQDDSGQTMWCHHSQSGHSLAWQYGDSSSEHG